MKVRKAHALQNKDHFLIDIAHGVQLAGKACFAQAGGDGVRPAIGEFLKPDTKRFGLGKLFGNLFNLLGQ